MDKLLEGCVIHTALDIFPNKIGFLTKKMLHIYDHCWSRDSKKNMHVKLINTFNNFQKTCSRISVINLHVEFINAQLQHHFFGRSCLIVIHKILRSFSCVSFSESIRCHNCRYVQMPPRKAVYLRHLFLEFCNYISEAWLI